jgi:hypothetical protein
MIEEARNGLYMDEGAKWGCSWTGGTYDVLSSGFTTCRVSVIFSGV